MNKLIYLTYQTFPADTANSIQTISTLKYFVRSGLNVELIFPNREISSSDNIKILQNKYQFKETFKIKMLDHNLPFGKVNKFEKIFFHLSHFWWSYKAVRYILKNSNKDVVFFTRSDWIYYFLSKKNLKVILECHQISKVRKFVINNNRNKQRSKVIFTTNQLREDFNIRKSFKNNTCVLNNAFDEDLFNMKHSRKINSVIFVGNLMRFNKERNLKFIINCFGDSRLNDCTLFIVGGPEDYKKELMKYSKNLNINNVVFLGRLSRQETINKMLKSKIGILINSKNNIHSTNHTSPLKYFEYLAAGLNIVAVDFPAHKSLPESNKIDFFNENNNESFITSVLNSINKENKIDNVEIYSYSQRIKNILDFIDIQYA